MNWGKIFAVHMSLSTVSGDTDKKRERHSGKKNSYKQVKVKTNVQRKNQRPRFEITRKVKIYFAHMTEQLMMWWF